MAEETKVEIVETTEQNATVEAEKAVEIDYDKELQEEQARREANALGYAARKAISVEPTVEETSSKDIADEVIKRILPVINSATQSNLIESKIDSMSGGNESLKRSIKWHMENSVNPSLDVNERAEAAYAIANKSVISKTLKEINIAQKNRVNIVGVGEGSSTEVHAQPGDNTLSTEQLNKLKGIAKGMNLKPGKETDDFIARAKQNLTH